MKQNKAHAQEAPIEEYLRRIGAPIADDFLLVHPTISHWFDDDVQKAMIEFAKVHVKFALDAQKKEIVNAWESLPGNKDRTSF